MYAICLFVIVKIKSFRYEFSNFKDLLNFFLHIYVLAIIRQMFEAERKVKRLNDPSKKEIENKIKNEIIPAFLRQMSEILIKNGGEFMVGKGVRIQFYL